MSYLSEHEVVVDLGVDITSIKDRNKYLENSVDKENSIISALDNKTRDNFASGMKFNSVRKKKLSDEKSYNELSQILRAKKVNENNFPIRNYRTMAVLMDSLI